MASETQFKVGDVVELKSGNGPRMTVLRMDNRPDGSEFVVCAWFLGEMSASAERDSFPPDALTIAGEIDL